MAGRTIYKYGWLGFGDRRGDTALYLSLPRLNYLDNFPLLLTRHLRLLKIHPTACYDRFLTAPSSSFPHAWVFPFPR